MESELTTPPNNNSSTSTKSSNETDDDSNITPPPHRSHHRTPPPDSVELATYKACLKNHAAPMGRHAVDGCGEFMPPPPTTAAASSAALLKCQACGCHRNFHRREPISPAVITAPLFLDFRRGSPARCFSLSPPSQPPQEKAAPPTKSAQRQMPLFTITTASAEDRRHAPATPTAEHGKRFRTKFTREQKDKMLRFAQRMEWKMQKCDENSVRDFCSEIGISRAVLKVWMHNHKKRIFHNTTTIDV